MTLIYSAESFPALEGRPETQIGGKGLTLLRLYNAGLPVPKAICIATSVYNLFIENNNLREKINLELHRKELKDMRWEEIWDISLRIKNLFLTGVTRRCSTVRLEMEYRNSSETNHLQYDLQPLMKTTQSTPLQAFMNHMSM